MKLHLELDTTNQDELLELAVLVNYYLKPSNKTAAAPASKKEAPVTSKNKAAPVVEEDEELEDEPNFDEDEELEDEPNFDEDEELEDEEEEEAPKKPNKPASKSTPSKTKNKEITDTELITTCQATNTRLDPKGKNKEKTQAKINALIKKHGGKSARSVPQEKRAGLVKELKSLGL